MQSCSRSNTTVMLPSPVVCNLRQGSEISVILYAVKDRGKAVLHCHGNFLRAQTSQKAKLLSFRPFIHLFLFNPFRLFPILNFYNGLVFVYLVFHLFLVKNDMKPSTVVHYRRFKKDFLLFCQFW